MKLQHSSCQSITLACLMMWGLVLSSGCSNGSDDAPFSQGPTADFSEELTGGDGPFIGAPAPANQSKKKKDNQKRPA